MQTNTLAANDTGAVASSKVTQFGELIKRLQPINRLPPYIVAELAEKSTIERFASEQDITETVRSSLFVHYLADGALTLVGSDGTTEHLESGTPQALKAIERRAGAYRSIVTVGPCALIRIPWELFEGFLLQFAPADLPTNSDVEVSEIFSSTISNWMVRILQSDLFSLLPATNIQEVLARMVLIPTAANQAIVEEGTAGDDFYIVESGQYVVTKKVAATGREIKLATLGPGESFGEAALMMDTPRCATVTASKPGNLLKLDGDHFRRWIMDPAINRVSADEAKSLFDSGYQGIDVREPAAYAAGSIPNSLNIGINVLRLNVNRLAADNKYIVCDSDPKIAALAAFLLSERGFNVRSLDVSINEFCEKYALELEVNEQQDPSGSVPVVMDKSDAPVNTQHYEEEQLPLTKLDKTLPEKVNRARTEPAIAPVIEIHQQNSSEASTREPDLGETVFGIGLSNLIGELGNGSNESSANDPANLAESTTTELTTNVVELVVAKDASDGTNKLRSGSSDQFGVFQHPLPADAVQKLPAIDYEDQLSGDAERLSNEMGARITEIIGKYLDIQRTELEHEFEIRIKAVKEDAVKSMRAHELKVAANYKAMQQKIKDDGQKLVAFANKLKRFKEDLQRSQMQTAEILTAKVE